MPSDSSSSLPVVIRLARDKDLEFVRSLAEQVFLTYGSYDRYLSEWFSTEGVSTYIAEMGGDRVGFFMLVCYPHQSRPSEAVADLLAIAVAPDYQARGVGTALLEKSLREAKRLFSPIPVREMHLSVAETNQRAQRLFSRHGFRVQNDRGLYPSGQRAIHMSKSLES